MTQVKQDNDSVTLCAGCNKKKGTKKCGGCKQFYYCSQKCQIDHWVDHKIQCKKIRKQNKLKQQHNKQSKSSSPSKKKLNNTFANNMKLQYQKENKKRRTPRIKVTKAINGIFKVKLLNEFLRNKKLDIEFQFDYKLLSDDKTNSQKQEWKSSNFTSSLIQGNGLFCVRMPLNLKGYFIKCRLRARLIDDPREINRFDHVLENNNDDDETESKWFDFSKEYKVSIPSSMIGTEFDVGDIVRYRPEDDYVVSYNSAQILEKLPNGYVKLKEIKSANIQYLKVREDEFILHQSRVSLPDNILSRNTLDFTNLDLNIDKTLLLKIGDENIENDEKMKVYNELFNVYTNYGKLWKLLQWKQKKRLDFFTFDIKSASIGRFIALEVMNYLYECNEFEWKINSCILDDTHGALKCNECLRAYFIKRNIEEGAIKTEKKRGSDMDGRYQICDVCSVTVDQFEYIYHCSAKMEDRHDICLNCIYSMIKQNNQLNGLLIDILTGNGDENRDEDDGKYHYGYNVNKDCIDVIVSFVVGKVVKIIN